MKTFTVTSNKLIFVDSLRLTKDLSIALTLFLTVGALVMMMGTFQHVTGNTLSEGETSVVGRMIVPQRVTSVESGTSSRYGRVVLPENVLQNIPSR